MLLAAARADQDEHVKSLDDLETQFEDVWSDPAADAVVAVNSDGRLCLYARLFVNPEPNAERTSFGTYAVHPDLRGSGHEDALLDWLEARSNTHRPPIFDGGPAEVRLRIARREQQKTEIERLTRRGYRHTRDYFRMRRDLDGALPQATYLPASWYAPSQPATTKRSGPHISRRSPITGVINSEVTYQLRRTS